MTIKEEVFSYLDKVRETGEINMFGAVAVIQQKFNLKRDEATRILTEWINTYGSRHSS